MDTHPALAGHPLADAAVEAHLAGLAAVDPTKLVVKAVRQGLLDDWLFRDGRERTKPAFLTVIALGKAAPRMLWGLVEAGVPVQGFGVTIAGVPAPLVDTFRWMAGEHPVPGPQSLAAGEALEAWIAARPRGEKILVLLSGGASSCVEWPTVGLAELQRMNRDLLAWGKSIEATNRERAKVSRLKAGGLGRRLLQTGADVRVWQLVDTSDPAAVGSGPLRVPGNSIPHVDLAGNEQLVTAAGLRLAAGGFEVHRHGRRIAGPVEEELRAFLAAADSLPAKEAALVGGGESLVALPGDAPPGGRCQHAALVAAKILAETGSNLLFMAAASDGADGATDAAGAWSTAKDWTPEAKTAVRNFSAHPFLDQAGRLVRTGPTGTNVNDLWVALRRD